MQVQSINNISFSSKNTYLERSKHAVTKLEKNYFKSLHHEAMARKLYLDYRKAESQLEEFEEGVNSLEDAWKVIKIFARMTSKKISSARSEADAYQAFPNRFIEPDDKNAYPWRHYKLKSFSKKMPSQIKNY